MISNCRFFCHINTKSMIFQILEETAIPYLTLDFPEKGFSCKKGVFESEKKE